MPKVFQEYKEEAKNRILEKTLEIFEKKGYRKTKIDDIAKELGVSKGAIYPYFNSKEELFKEAITFSQENMEAEIFEKIPESDLDGNELFELFLSNMTKGNQKLGIEILSLSTNDPNFMEIVSEHIKKDIKILEEFFSRQKRKGILQENTDTKDLAEKITVLLFGLNSMMVYDMTEERAKEIWNTTVRLWIEDYRD